MSKAKHTKLLSMTAQIVSNYVANHSVSPADVPALIETVGRVLSGLSEEAKPVKAAEPQQPAVPIRRSVHPDYIVCLEDGRRLKMLKRHLRTVYGMTPDQYRAKWGLPSDYPMVAPNYTAERSRFAKRIGLGHVNGEPVRLQASAE